MLRERLQGLILRIRQRPKLWAGAAAGLLVMLWPRKAKALVYPSNAERDARFGPLKFTAAPTERDPEAVRITNDFANKIIVRYIPIIGRVEIHKDAADSLEDVMNEIERKGLAHEIHSFDGSFVPRYVRGSSTNLSSHSYATSIDINAASNPRGSAPSPGQKKLAPIFEKHGWYWGDKFPIRDPMHFEYVG